MRKGLHSKETCKDPDCQLCQHGEPPGCGCNNLECFCACCGEGYTVAANSYKPGQGCRDCGCNLVIIHEDQRVN